MGYDVSQIVISTRVSRHNSEQDRKDDRAVADLARLIEDLTTNVSRFARVATLVRHP